MLGPELMSKKFNFRFANGFTLMELMIAITILAILASAAVPSVQDILRSNRVTGQTNELVSMINFARNTAIRTSGDVTVTLAPSADGWSGIVEDPDEDDSTNCTTAGALRCAANKNVLLSGETTLVFDKRGYLKDAAFLTSGNVTIDAIWLEHENCNNERHRNRIEVRPTGQVTSCNVACGNTGATC